MRQPHPRALGDEAVAQTRSGADGGSDAAVLVKPFSLAGLATLVRATLDR